MSIGFLNQIDKQDDWGHWQKEIEDFEESIQNRIDELKKRGEKL